MSAVAVMIEPFVATLDAKLGRCARCMRLSAMLTAGSWLIVAAATATGVELLRTAALIPALAFTTLSGAHGIAYLTRQPAAACTPCARKARQRRRAARLREIKSWFSLSRPPARRPTGRSRECLACKKASLETLLTAPDELPGADNGLLDVLRGSAEYQSIAPELADSAPADTWQGDLRNYFLFRLRPDASGVERQALFVARWEDYGLLSAVMIIPDAHGGEPHVIDLRTHVM